MSCEAQPTQLERGHFFGVNRLERQVGGFLLSETHYPRRRAAPPHLHALPYFGFLLAGGYVEQISRRPVSFAPLSFVFHPAGDVHFGHVGDSGARLLHVEIAPNVVDQLWDDCPLPAESLERHSGLLVSLSQRLYREFRSTDAASSLVIEGLALQILGELARRVPQPDNGPRWLHRAREVVHSECSRPLTIQSVAAEVGVSSVRLSRAFRKAFGESLGSYQRRLRIRQACDLLCNEEMSVAEIALVTGFADQSHFTRVFRRITGTTPAAYRRHALL